MKNRIHSLDLFRAIASILITGYHVWIFIGRPEKAFYIWNFYAPFFKPIGVVGFVFISGFVTHSPGAPFSAIEFISKRFKRVVAPYYIAVFIWSLMIVSGILVNKTPGVKDIVTHLLFIHNLHPSTFYSISGVFWYLGLQVQLYLLYVLIRKQIRRHIEKILIISFISCLAFNIFPQYIVNNSVLGQVLYKSVFSYAFPFLAAIFIKERIDTIRPLLQKPQVYLTFCALVVSWMFYNGFISPYYELEKIFMGILFGLALIGAPRINDKNLIFKPIQVIALASYSTYLYNFIFHAVHTSLYGLRAFGFNILFTLAFGIAAYYTIEKPLKLFWQRIGQTAK